MYILIIYILYNILLHNITLFFIILIVWQILNSDFNTIKNLKSYCVNNNL